MRSMRSASTLGFVVFYSRVWQFLGVTNARRVLDVVNLRFVVEFSVGIDTTVVGGNSTDFQGHATVALLSIDPYSGTPGGQHSSG